MSTLNMKNAPASALHLPKVLPTLRRATKQELEMVAGWIALGRAEGAFSNGPSMSSVRLRRYVRAQEQRYDEYELQVIEQDGNPCGYVDYAQDCGRIELLGLFLTPSYRRQNIGTFVLRLLISRWIYARHHEVEVRVFSDNAASLRMCLNVGFLPNRIEHEGHREVSLLRKALVSPQRISPLNEMYSSLTGTNCVASHLALATAIAEHLSRVSGVHVVLGLGSVSRGFADEWSDVDLAIIGRSLNSKLLWKGENWIAGADVDFFVVDLAEDPINKWDTSRRQAFAEGIVLASNENDTLQAIIGAVRMDRAEVRTVVVDRLLTLAWIGYAPPDWRDRHHRGYYWSLPADLWVRRGCLSSAHGTIDQALDFLMELLFASNYILPPDRKWRRFLVTGLDWKPHQFEMRIKQVEECPRTLDGFAERSKVLLGLVGETAAYLETRRLLPTNMYSYYLQHSEVY